MDMSLLNPHILAILGAVSRHVFCVFSHTLDPVSYGPQGVVPREGG